MKRNDGILGRSHIELVEDNVSWLLLDLLDLMHLLHLLLLVVILFGEFFHEIRDDDGRGSGGADEAVDEDLVTTRDGFVDEGEGLVEGSLDGFVHAVTEIDLLLADAVGGEKRFGKVAFVRDVENVKDATIDELLRVKGVHGGSEVNAGSHERGCEVAVVASGDVLLILDLDLDLILM